MKLTKLLTIAIALVLGLSAAARAQVIVPTGVTTTKASQLLHWFNIDDENIEETTIQVVNTSNTSGVTIHIQVWGSDNPTGIPGTDPCREFNFTDELTPNDMHIYAFENLWLNTDSCNAGVGDCTIIADLIAAGITQGFVTITPS